MVRGRRVASDNYFLTKKTASVASHLTPENFSSLKKCLYGSYLVPLMVELQALFHISTSRMLAPAGDSATFGVYLPPLGNTPFHFPILIL